MPQRLDGSKTGRPTGVDAAGYPRAPEEAAHHAIANEVLDVRLDYFSQFAPLWVFITYLVIGRHDKSTARSFALVAIAVTAAVLGLHAL